MSPPPAGPVGSDAPDCKREANCYIFGAALPLITAIRNAMIALEVMLENSLPGFRLRLNNPT
jgi:hypothetical protein